MEVLPLSAYIPCLVLQENLLMNDVAQEIKNRLDIVALISEKIRLKKSGKNWTGLCPFHQDKHPSFTVSSEMGRYRCWSCGASGDIFNWLMEMEKLDFPQALEILAARTGVEIAKGKQNRTGKAELEHIMSEAQSFFVNALSKNTAAKKYLEDRKFPQEIIAKWGLGFAPDVGDALSFHLKKQQLSLSHAKDLYLVEKDSRGGYYDRFKGRITFPILGYRGNIIAYGGRVIGKGMPKYINSSDTPLFHKRDNLYGFYQAKDAIIESDCALLVEGYSDVIRCHQYGFTNAVASLGTAFTENQAQQLKKWCSKVIIIYDSDDAGIKATQKAAEILVDVGLFVKIVHLTKGDDPDSILIKEGKEKLAEYIAQAIHYVAYKIELLKNEQDPDSPVFWNTAYQLLRECTDPLVLEQQIIHLSSLHPGLNDAMAARDAIRKKVLELKKQDSKSVEKSVKTSFAYAAPGRIKKRIYHPYETVVFAALQREDTFMAALDICKHSEWFITKAGTITSAEIYRYCDKKNISCVNSEVLSNLSDDRVKKVLEELYFTYESPIHLQSVKDAGEKLRSKWEKNQLSSLRSAAKNDDSSLAEISNRLKSISKSTKSSGPVA